MAFKTVFQRSAEKCRARIATCVGYITSCIQEEINLQTAFLHAWRNDTSMWRKGSMFALYLPCLLPNRVWVLLPDPNRMAILLITVCVMISHFWPEYTSWVHVCGFMVFFPLLQATLFACMYYCMPNGKNMLCMLFYDEKNMQLFFGHPLKHLHPLATAVATLVILAGLFVANTMLDNYMLVEDAKVRAENAEIHTRIVKKYLDMLAANATNSEKLLKLFEEHGLRLTEEQIKQVYNDAKTSMDEFMAGKDFEHVWNDSQKRMDALLEELKRKP